MARQQYFRGYFVPMTCAFIMCLRGMLPAFKMLQFQVFDPGFTEESLLLFDAETATRKNGVAEPQSILNATSTPKMLFKASTDPHEPNPKERTMHWNAKKSTRVHYVNIGGREPKSTLNDTNATRTLETSLKAALEPYAPEPKKRVVPWNATKSRKVHFIKFGQLDTIDFFSATWIQPVSTFLMFNTSSVDYVEAGCVQVIRRNLSRLRMTLDWFDFSVEHMSKWWNVLGIFNGDPVPYNKAISSFQHYVTSVRVDAKDSTMQNTIAIIAFRQYRTKPDPEKGRTVTIAALAATVASLMQAGFGRVVVVGYRDDDEEVAQETFRYIQNKSAIDEAKSTGSTEMMPITMLGRMEVGFARVTEEEVKSVVVVNMVRGALIGLQTALKGDLNDKRTEEFLGTTHEPSFWRYVYLTEPDTILQTRPSALPQLKAALDQGMILTPHRLQPIPHESDVKGMRNRNKYVPASGQFSSVIELDPLQGGVCCDEHARHYKPGKEMPRCGSFWWTCGFKFGRNHSRLEPYQLMRLQPGTGIVTLAGTAHGRRCIPSTNSVCVPPK